MILSFTDKKYIFYKSVFLLVSGEFSDFTLMDFSHFLLSLLLNVFVAFVNGISHYVSYLFIDCLWIFFFFGVLT